MSRKSQAEDETGPVEGEGAGPTHEPVKQPYQDAVAEVAAGTKALCEAGVSGGEAVSAALELWRMVHATGAY